MGVNNSTVGVNNSTVGADPKGAPPGAGRYALPSSTHRKQCRWYSLPSAKYRCTRCTRCPQAAQVLLGGRCLPCSDRLSEERSSPCRKRGTVTSHAAPGSFPSRPVSAMSLKGAPSSMVLTHEDLSPRRGRGQETSSPSPTRGSRSPERGNFLCQASTETDPDFQLPRKGLLVVQSFLVAAPASLPFLRVALALQQLTRWCQPT